MTAPYRVSASIGVQAPATDSTTVDELLARADAQMYQEKKAGADDELILFLAPRLPRRLLFAADYDPRCSLDAAIPTTRGACRGRGR